MVAHERPNIYSGSLSARSFVCLKKCKEAKEVVFRVQMRSSVRWTPRNLVLLTISPAESLMWNGVWTVWAFLNSTVFFVLFTFRSRLPLPQLSSCSTFFLLDELSLLLMRPTTVVLSANLMKLLELYCAVQSWDTRLKRSGLSTQTWWVLAFSLIILEVVCTDVHWLRPLV